MGQAWAGEGMEVGWVAVRRAWAMVLVAAWVVANEAWVVLVAGWLGAGRGKGAPVGVRWGGLAVAGWAEAEGRPVLQCRGGVAVSGLL
jgi:hypothetical protein